MGILYLSREDLVKVGAADMSLMVDILKRVLKLHAAKDCIQPPKPILLAGNGEEKRAIAMPCFLGGEFQIWGIKWTGSRPQNPTKRNIERVGGLIVLNEPETMYPIAILEGGLITIMRTAAISIIAAKYLARIDTATLGVAGAGGLGSMVAKSLVSIFKNLQKVTIFDIQRERAATLAEEICRNQKIDVEIAKEVALVACGSDILVTATTVAEGYIEGDWLKSGSLLVALASRDLKASAVERADKIVVDDWAEVSAVLNAYGREGFIKEDEIHAEIGEVISGIKPGREKDDEVILVSAAGMGIEDIGVSSVLYSRAKDRGLGTDLDLYRS